MNTHTDIPCMTREAEKAFRLNPEADAYRVQLAGVVLSQRCTIGRLQSALRSLLANAEAKEAYIDTLRGTERFDEFGGSKVDYSPEMTAAADALALVGGKATT